MFGIDDAINVGMRVLERVIPDPAAKAEAQQKLLELQQNGELKLEEFSVKREEIAATDRSSARSMQEEALKQDDLFSKRFIYAFTIFWSVGSSLYIGCITFMVIPDDNIRFADTILGFLLGTAIAGMFTYFYGSTASAKVKDSTIANLVRR